MTSNGGTSEDIAFRVRFTEPDEHGKQQVQVRRADGPAACHGTAGTLLGEGGTGEVFSLDGNGLAGAGLTVDPFTGDGVALGRFLEGTTSAPHQATSTFPYLSPSQPATLPALVDLYFRQPQGAGQ